MIPGELQVLFNLRYNPTWRAEQLRSTQCEAILRAHGLDYAIHWHRGGEPFHHRRKVRCAPRRARCWRASPAAPPEESTGGGTSDARFIAPLGAQCIEIGPVNASIHKVDEHVAVADLEALPGPVPRTDRALLSLAGQPAVLPAAGCESGGQRTFQPP